MSLFAKISIFHFNCVFLQYLVIICSQHNFLLTFRDRCCIHSFSPFFCVEWQCLSSTKWEIIVLQFCFPVCFNSCCFSQSSARRIQDKQFYRFNVIDVAACSQIIWTLLYCLRNTWHPTTMLDATFLYILFGLSHFFFWSTTEHRQFFCLMVNFFVDAFFFSWNCWAGESANILKPCACSATFRPDTVFNSYTLFRLSVRLAVIARSFNSNSVFYSFNCLKRFLAVLFFANVHFF